MRLLICKTCKTIEQLPDYTGPLEQALVPSPDGNLIERLVPPEGADVHLDYLTEPHRRGEHEGNLVQVPDEQWAVEQVRADVVRQIQEAMAGGTTGLDPEAYALKDTFQEEALKCFAAHRRPQNGCIDWHDRSKRIGNSLLDWSERKLLKKEGITPKKQFLCDFCPVASQVQGKKFEKEGLYD